jgi:hypothetical protein
VLRRRRRLIAILVPVGVLFLVIAFGVARFLTVENVERDRLYALARAEARGDTAAVLRQLHACDAACTAKVRAFVPRLRFAAGDKGVKIARLDSGTAYTLGTNAGWSRLVWVADVNARPVVQCVWVTRKGSPLTGRSVSLRRLSAPLADNEDSC